MWKQDMKRSNENSCAKNLCGNAALCGLEATGAQDKMANSRLYALALHLTFLFSAICVAVSGAAPAFAQSAAASVNKYLTENPTPTPNAGSSFSNVTSPETATPYTYVVTVDYGSSGSGTVSIADNLPPGFVVTGCSAFLDATPTTVPGCPTSGMIGGSIGPFPASSSGGHRITLYINGSFTIGGQVTNSATATVPAGTATGEVTSFINTLPPNFNLAVTKTADHVTAAFGDTIVYTTTVTNTGTGDVPMLNVVAPIVALYDRLTNPSNSVELDVTWGWLSCTSLPASPQSTCLSAPLAQTTAPTTLAPGQSLDIFSNLSNSVTGATSDGSAGGILKPGASITIQYYVTVETQEPCAPIPTQPALKNRSYLGLGGSGGNFPDSNPLDNASEVTIPLTGLPTTCPPPPLKVSKAIIPNPTSPLNWGLPITYRITVTNVSGSSVQLKYKDLVRGAPATTVFDATMTGSVLCLGSNPCTHTQFSPTWIGSAPQKIFESTPATGFTLLAGQSFNLTYQVSYSALCAVNGDPVKIANLFDIRGKVLATTPVNFHIVKTHIATMKALPVCDLAVSKTWKPIPPVNPATPAQFGSVIGTYQIKWANLSPTFGVNVGTIWDVLHIDDPLYATVPVTFSIPSCTRSSGGPINNLLSSSTSTMVSPTLVPWQGAQAIRIVNTSFAPNESLSCEFTITAHRPLPNDPNCQSQGTPNLWNTALADLDPAYDPNTAPWQSSTVSKRLPLCRNVTIQKTATPTKVLPGDPINWSLIFKNNGPTPNLPISFTSIDVVPGGLLPISSGPYCGFGSGGSSCSTNLTAGTITTSISNLPAGQQIGVIFTSTSPTSTPPQFIQNKVKAVDDPGYYYHTPYPTGSASIATGWPTVTKAFTPNKVFGGGQAVSLTFTITNLSYTPNVTGMSFADQLPPGLTPGTATSNCGPVSVTSGGLVSLSNGALPATLGSGTASCQFTVPITYDRCGTFNNTPANVQGIPVKVDTSGLQATLTVACLKALTGDGIDSGNYRGFGCALYDSGDAKCWGTGALGRPVTPTTADLVVGNAPANQIDAGTTQVCTTTKLGNVQCWGENSGGQLGNGSTAPQLLPSGFVLTTSSTLDRITEVSTGGTLSCGIRVVGTSRRLWCWGRLGTYNPGPLAQLVPGIINPVSVSVSVSHVCVLRTGGTAQCFGGQMYGALGNGNPASTTIPPGSAVTVPLTNLRAIKSGEKNTCAIKGSLISSNVYCWGFNGSGPTANLLGTGPTTINILTPSPVLLMPTSNLRNLTVADSASGGWHHCVTYGLTRAIKCWGTDSNNQIGSGPPSPLKGPTTGPVLVTGAPSITVGLDASNGKTCAIVGGVNALNAKVLCWGSRALGRQLGDGNNSPAMTPVPVVVTGIP
jgi:hypothetical protein